MSSLGLGWGHGGRWCCGRFCCCWWCGRRWWWRGCLRSRWSRCGGGRGCWVCACLSRCCCNWSGCAVSGREGGHIRHASTLTLGFIKSNFGNSGLRWGEVPVQRHALFWHTLWYWKVSIFSSNFRILTSNVTNLHSSSATQRLQFMSLAHFSSCSCTLEMVVTTTPVVASPGVKEAGVTGSSRAAASLMWGPWQRRLKQRVNTLNSWYKISIPNGSNEENFFHIIFCLSWEFYVLLRLNSTSWFWWVLL